MIAFLVDLRQGNKKKESRISNFFCSFACMTVFLVCAICYTIFATRVHVLKGYKRALGTVKSSYISVSGSNSQRYETSWYCSLYFNKKWDLIRRNNYKFLQDDDGVYMSYNFTTLLRNDSNLTKIPRKLRGGRGGPAGKGGGGSSSSDTTPKYLMISYYIGGEINKTTVDFTKNTEWNSTSNLTSYYRKVKFSYTGGRECGMKGDGFRAVKYDDICRLALDHGFIGGKAIVYYKPPDYRFEEAKAEIFVLRRYFILLSSGIV